VSAAACAAVERESEEAPELVSAAKAYIGQYGVELLQDCVQLHGGIGVTFEHDLHLYLRRVIVDRALAGTPADHLQRIAGAVDGRAGDEVAA
jgi:alkylation response protein AidB-like acyl-CoA dehydrogenase